MAQPDSRDRIPAIEFITAVFGNTTERPVFFQTLANDKGDELEARIKSQLLTREADRVVRFAGKHDRFRRGMFFCVATLAEGSSTRNKETVRETPCLHADLDFKNLVDEAAEIRIALSRLRCQPSIVVRSGGGLHCYWLFKESLDTQANMERIEAALKRLAECIGGDPSVCEVSRLMRLPGTHNSKYGDMREVVCERLDAERRYELDDLEAWLSEFTAPILMRKPAESKPAGIRLVADTEPENAFTIAGKKYGFQPALDVEAMLNAMAPGNVHDTQVRVTAALMRAGHDVEEVVAMLLDVTRTAVAGVGAKWNWKIEERNLRNMCESGLKKYRSDTPDPDPAPDPEPESLSDPPSDSESKPESESSSDAAPDPKVVGIQEGKAQLKKRKVAATAIHIVLAEAVLAVMRQRAQDLMFTNKGDYRYFEGLWNLETRESLRAWLNARIEEGARGLRIESTIKLISEAQAYILRSPELHRADVPFDRHGKIPTLSGLINPRSGDVEPPLPEHFCTWRLPFAFNPQATCPHWLQMLEDVFADRGSDNRALFVQLIQELLGAGTIDVRSKAMSRALMFIGGSNYGKSSLIDVMAGLFGPRRNSTPLDALEKNDHGTMAFTHRAPWVLHEAFDAGKWHMSSTVKAIISGDAIHINVKNGKIFEHLVTVPIFWGSNVSPQFKEATKAITNRIVVIDCRREFDPKNPVGTDLVARQHGYEKPQDFILATEMEGVLAWAVEGLRRALARGHFVLPAEAQKAIDNVRRDSNIVVEFVETCITFNPNGMVSTADFAAAHTSWWYEHKGDDRTAPASERIGVALRALSEPRIATDRDELRHNSRRYYAGISLNAEGKRHWQNSVTSTAFMFQTKTASTTAPDDNPNKAIAPDWDDKTAIIAMRKAHEIRDRTGHYDSGHPQKAQGDRTSGVTDLNVSGHGERSAEQLSELSKKPRF